MAATIFKEDDTPDIAESEKSAFQEEVVKKKIREVIELHLKNEEYKEEKVAQWINNICESCMEELSAPKKPFKYLGILLTHSL
jgi:hypothetical protein